MDKKTITKFKCKRTAFAFTMAEILISLTIIGVIAAITLPSLRANINESSWATQRKALYSRMSQAIAMMPALNGYGIGATDAETASNATQAFISEGLSKVLKINNICDSTNFSKCGITSKIKTFRGETLTTPTTFYDMFSLNHFVSQNHINTKAVAFETTNGESVIAYYNPNCRYFDINTIDYNNTDDTTNDILPDVCVNFVYDLNNKKGPNKVGKDIGYITVLSPTDSTVTTALPYEKSKALAYADAVSYCRGLGGDYRLPTIYDLATIHANIRLLENDNYINAGIRFWSTTRAKNGLPITLYLSYARLRAFTNLSIKFTAQCVKR